MSTVRVINASRLGLLLRKIGRYTAITTQNPLRAPGFRVSRRILDGFCFAVNKFGQDGYNFS
jgi:hypothetical protein